MNERTEGERPRDTRDEENAGSPPPEPAGQKQPVCAACGKPIAQDDLVCPHCGTRLVSG